MWEQMSSQDPLGSNLKSLYSAHKTSSENKTAPPLQLQQQCLPIIFYVPPITLILIKIPNPGAPGFVKTTNKQTKQNTKKPPQKPMYFIVTLCP